MSSYGELYITEDVRDSFEDKLNNVFGKNEWYLNGNNNSGVCSADELDKKITVDVYDYEDVKIGEIVVENGFEIEKEAGERYINAYPNKLLKVSVVKK